MSTSRRDFLRTTFSVAGGWMLLPLGCNGCRSCRQPAPVVGRGEQQPKRARTQPALAEPGYVRLAKRGELQQREQRLWQLLRACRLCPRECGVDRVAGETGVCSSTAQLEVHSAGPHHGEERPLRGKNGSGTVFFTNCNLLCCFCINWQINHRGDGEVMDHAALARMMLRLQNVGCHNINVVTPTHVAPHIVRALRLAVPMGLRLPVVYNTSGYDNLEVIQLLDGIVDIYLPDFKYQDSTLAATYSAGAKDYPQVARTVIKEMHRQVGDLTLDDRGLAQRGLLIRHLVLPHNIAGTDRFVQWVARELGPKTAVNLMDQYRPAHRANDYPKLARRLTLAEWRQARRWAQEAGLARLVT
jgi:putative pyruvate formate lyase activating enzyme